MMKNKKYINISIIALLIFSLILILMNRCFSPNLSKENIQEAQNFGEERSILKMKTDTFIRILTYWHELDSNQYKRPFLNEGDTNWIVWPYNKRYEDGIMNSIFGGEELLKRQQNNYFHDKDNGVIKFRVMDDTAYVYVRLITQFIGMQKGEVRR